MVPIKIKVSGYDGEKRLTFLILFKRLIRFKWSLIWITKDNENTYILIKISCIAQSTFCYFIFSHNVSNHLIQFIILFLCVHWDFGIASCGGIIDSPIIQWHYFKATSICCSSTKIRWACVLKWVHTWRRLFDWLLVWRLVNLLNIGKSSQSPSRNRACTVVCIMRDSKRTLFWSLPTFVNIIDVVIKAI